MREVILSQRGGVADLGRSYNGDLEVVGRLQHQVEASLKDV